VTILQAYYSTNKENSAEI